MICSDRFSYPSEIGSRNSICVLGVDPETGQAGHILRIFSNAFNSFMTIARLGGRFFSTLPVFPVLANAENTSLHSQLQAMKDPLLGTKGLINRIPVRTMAMSNAQFEKALDKYNEINITVRGRKSGRSISLPVWFLHEPGKLKLLPVRGTRTNWYHNIQKNPTIQIQAGPSRFSGKARIIEDKAKIREAAEGFTAKYGADNFKRYYPIVDVTVEVPV